MLAALLCVFAGIASAQEGAQAAPSPPRGMAGASPLLPAEHWAVRAARKAEALGLVEGFLPAQRLVPRGVVGATLREAARTAAEREPGVAALTRSWSARFAEEFSEVRERAAAGGLSGVSLRGSAALRYDLQTGRAAPGLAEFPPDRTGALPLPDREGAALWADLAAYLGSHVVVQVVPELDADGIELQGAELAAGWGAWRLSVGRRPVGYGWGRGGGVVLSGTTPLDRVEIETRRPVELPGWFGVLGPAAFNAFLSRLPEERHPGRPFFWGGRGAVQPHPRLVLSVQRAAMFGGDGSDLPVTAGNLLDMLIGRVSGGAFENQEVSAAIRYRLPTETVLPLTAYLEWGSEDAAGAWWDVPGRTWGLYVPALPGSPQLALGVEHASFSGRCCGNPGWYRHFAFPGSWAVEDRVLGHPLGGHGSEWLLYTHADLLDARLRVEGRGFRREREAENLFVPGRAGESLGFSVEALWRPAPGADLHFGASREAGDGWSEAWLNAGARVFFGD